MEFDTIHAFPLGELLQKLEKQEQEQAIKFPFKKKQSCNISSTLREAKE